MQVPEGQRGMPCGASCRQANLGGSSRTGSSGGMCVPGCSKPAQQAVALTALLSPCRQPEYSDLRGGCLQVAYTEVHHLFDHLNSS